MNNRIKIVRETFGLSRKAFGDRIGVSGDTINNLERGRAEIKEPIIKLICTEFHISEQWLRTGEGMMRVPMTQAEHIANLVAKVMNMEENSFAHRLIAVLDSLSPDEWEFLEQKARMLVEGEEIKKDPG